MKEIAVELKTVVTAAVPVLLGLDPESLTRRPAPGEWTKKEILGHLIDSAANNHQRFVRAAIDPTGVTRHVYQPVEWVRVEQCNEMDWAELVELWSAYNRHLSRVIANLPEETGRALCDIGHDAPVTLAWIVSDYLRHLNMHLQDIYRKTI